MENSKITFTLEEEEEKREILVRIRVKYHYSSEKAVLYYLNKIYPNPEVMDYEEKKYFFQLKVALLNLLEEQIYPKYLDIIRDRFWRGFVV